MKTKPFNFVAALLFAVALLFYPLLFGAATAQVSTQWGHLADGYSITEYHWGNQVCNIIDTYFTNSGYNSQNNYWTSSTSGNFQNTLQTTQNPNGAPNWASTFWVGDFTANNADPWSYGFNTYGEAMDSAIYDFDIYNYANNPQASIQYVNVIWTCVNGGLQWNDTNGNQLFIPGISYPLETPTATPPVNLNTYYGSTYPNQMIVGIPYALTGTLNMSTSGYSNSDNGAYCYIGFENDSPALSWPVPYDWSSTTYQFGYFPVYFYQYALGQDGSGKHNTIHDSLDYASFMTFGYDNCWVPYNFDRSLLNTGYWHQNNLGSGMTGYWYCQMRVLGNTNLIYPYTE
jgi:hypothetical protein